MAKKAPKRPWFEQWLHRLNVKAIYGILALVTFIAFFPSLGNDFTNWDDPQYVTENEALQDRDLNLDVLVTQEVGGNWHPVTMISLKFNQLFGGLSPFGFHFTNLFLHCLNTTLVFVLIIMLFPRQRFTAFMTSFLFGIHPMHVESVAWITARKDVLYVFFLLLGLISYLYYRQSEEKNYYWAAIGLALLSLLSKSAAVVFPVLMLMFLWLQNKKLEKKDFLESIPFFVMSIGIGIVAIITQSRSSVVEPAFSLGETLVFPFRNLAVYVGKFFAPLNLSAIYPYPPDGSPLGTGMILTAIGGLAIIALVGWLGKKEKIFWYGFLFFLVNIVLLLQFFRVGNALISDRYTYLAYIGLALIPAYLIPKYYLSKTSWQSGLAKAGLGVMLIGSVIFLKLTWDRTQVWQNSETLFSDAVEKQPGAAVAWYNLGHYYIDKTEPGTDRPDPDFKAAEDAYLKALEINSVYFDARYNLGFVYLSQGFYQKAIDNFNQSIALDPNQPEQFNNRGNAWLNLNELDKSLADYNRALEIDPYHFEALLNRGLLYMRFPNYEASLADLSQAIAIDPTRGHAWFSRAFLYDMMGNKAKALADAQKAVELGYPIPKDFWERVNR